MPDLTAAPAPGEGAAPAPGEGAAPAPGEGAEHRWSLSPSRALDFKNCALLYRFRVIDRLPEPASLEAARGTVIHGILERIFDLPASERTSVAALADVEPGWQALLEEEPEVRALLGDDAAGLPELVASTQRLLEGYFELEDPRRLEPAEREVLVETTLPSGVHLKGFIDRLDRAPSGDLRVVDYKSGKAPSEAFEGKALFQLRFYALVLWRTTGVLPRMLRLYYLADRERLDYTPDAADLESLERQLEAIASAIEKARASGDWRHKPSKLCNWCSFHAYCPEFGGVPPELPSTQFGGVPPELPSAAATATSPDQDPPVSPLPLDAVRARSA